MTDTLQTAVVGVSGYAGAELARLLLHHPRLKNAPPVFAGRVDAKDEARGGVPLEEIHPQLAAGHPTSLKLEPFSWELLASRGVQVLFLATPHEQSRVWVPEALARGLRVIDLSGAWRLTDAANRAIYNFEDEGSAQAEAIQAQAVYGLPELHRSQIVGARLIANPGCYATSVILALRPLIAAGIVDLGRGIVADSKSGVSGAGKVPSAKTHFMYAADNLSAYGVFTHRHAGELLSRSPSMKARSSSRPICFPFRAEFFPPFTCISAKCKQRRPSPASIEISLPPVPWCAFMTKRCRRFNIRCAHATRISGFSLPPMADAPSSSVVLITC